MTYDVATTVRAWLDETAAPIADPVDIYPAVAAAVHRTPQQRGRLTPLLDRRSLDMATVSSFIAAGVALALIGGFLFSASIDGGPSGEVLPAAPAPSATDAPIASPEATARLEATRRPERSPPPYPGHAVEFEAALVLPGQVQTATAKLCLKGKCYPANEARWVVGQKKYRDLIEPRRGARVRVTAKDKIGGMEIRVKGRWGKVPGYGYAGASYATGIQVRPLPGETTLAWRRRHGGTSWVFPDEQVLRLGQYVALTSWACPTQDGDGYGDDRQPGTADDDCTVTPIDSARPLPGSGMSYVNTFGPSVLMHVDSFVDLGDGLNAAGVFLRYGEPPDDGVEIPWLYVRDKPWRGPFLGDVDADGDVDTDDRAAISDAIDQAADGAAITLDAASWDDALDLNSDRVIDETDLQLVETLIEHHSTAAG